MSETDSCSLCLEHFFSISKWINIFIYSSNVVQIHFSSSSIWFIYTIVKVVFNYVCRSKCTVNICQWFYNIVLSIWCAISFVSLICMITTGQLMFALVLFFWYKKTFCDNSQIWLTLCTINFDDQWVFQNYICSIVFRLELFHVYKYFLQTGVISSIKLEYI